MSDIVFDLAKGRALAWGDSVNDDGAVVLLLLKADGIEGDSGMMKRTTVTDLLLGSVEQDAMGRLTIDGPDVLTVLSDTTADAGLVGLVTPVQIFASTAGDTIGAVVIAYKPNGATTDDDLIPWTKHECSFEPDGTDLEINFGDAFFGAT